MFGRCARACLEGVGVVVGGVASGRLVWAESPSLPGSMDADASSGLASASAHGRSRRPRDPARAAEGRRSHPAALRRRHRVPRRRRLDRHLARRRGHLCRVIASGGRATSSQRFGRRWSPTTAATSGTGLRTSRSWGRTSFRQAEAFISARHWRAARAIGFNGRSLWASELELAMLRPRLIFQTFPDFLGLQVVHAWCTPWPTTRRFGEEPGGDVAQTEGGMFVITFCTLHFPRRVRRWVSFARL